MTWQIAGLLGDNHHRSGVDGHGWLWEIHRGSEARRVLVEVSGSGWSVSEAGGNLASETAAAIKSEGRSEVDKVLGLEEPPRIILCSSMGCQPRDLNASE